MGLFNDVYVVCIRLHVSMYWQAHARNGQWIMTLDHVWLPLVDEYGVVVLRSAETETKEEEEGGSGGSGDVLPTHRE